MDASKCFYEYRPAANFFVTDEDAADFLQSQFTNELRPFATGQCTYGLWLDVKGKVIADSIVLCEGAERFRVLSELCPGGAIAAHLQRHIVADEVEIGSDKVAYAIELSGAGMRALGLELPPTGRFLPTAGGLLFSVRADAYTLVADSEAFQESLRARLLSAGFRALSPAERGLVRIRAGIPLVPVEIGATDLPGEGELEREAVSFNKGCYLGQEVVARMHHVGKPQRRLFIVGGEAPLPAVPCALYNRDGKLVGELRSAYPDGGGWTGVALLKTRFADTGACLHDESMDVSVIQPLREGTHHA